MSTYITLSYGDLLLGAVLIVLEAGLSLLLRLGLARQMLVASLRMAVQLGLMGMVLTSLFALQSPWWTALAALVMTGFSGYEIAARQEKSLAGWWRWGVGTGAITVSTALVTLLALLTALRPDPWFDPRFAIPLLGMILGNTMNGVALGLNVITSGAVAGRAGIEAQLMLGATRFQALAPLVRKSMRMALLPIINTMAAGRSRQIPNHDLNPGCRSDRRGGHGCHWGRILSHVRCPASTAFGPVAPELTDSTSNGAGDGGPAPGCV